MTSPDTSLPITNTTTDIHPDHPEYIMYMQRLGPAFWCDHHQRPTDEAMTCPKCREELHGRIVLLESK